MLALVRLWSCPLSVDTVPAEDECRSAQRDARAIGQRDPPHRLAVDKRAVGGAKVDEDYLAVLHAQLGVVPGHAGIDQAQIAVGATAEYGQRRAQLVGALGAAVGAWFRPGHQQPRRSREAPGRGGQIADRPADLAVLDRGAP